MRHCAQIVLVKACRYEGPRFFPSQWTSCKEGADSPVLSRFIHYCSGLAYWKASGSNRSYLVKECAKDTGRMLGWRDACTMRITHGLMIICLLAGIRRRYDGLSLWSTQARIFCCRQHNAGRA